MDWYIYFRGNRQICNVIETENGDVVFEGKKVFSE